MILVINVCFIDLLWTFMKLAYIYQNGNGDRNDYKKCFGNKTGVRILAPPVINILNTIVLTWYKHGSTRYRKTCIKAFIIFVNGNAYRGMPE